MTLFFDPWLLAGIAISAGILYAGVQASPRYSDDRPRQPRLSNWKGK
jgi:hypothetical protein